LRIQGGFVAPRLRFAASALAKRKVLNFKKFALSAALLIALSGCASTPAFEAKNPVTWVEGACSQQHQGVTLAIDYLGKVTTRCAVNFKGNGWDLFDAAGISVKGTNKYPTAFACQINGEPSQAKCDDSAGAYWGYYILNNGTWGYATTGASDHQAGCGEAEGWVYMVNEETESHLPTPAQYSCK
jgi:hypothetical protein